MAPHPRTRPNWAEYGLVGTVNLPNGGRAKTEGFPLALRGDAQFSDLAPGDHRLGTKRAIVR